MIEIAEFPNYSVDSNGNVLNVRKKKYMNKAFNNNGYLFVNLHKDGKLFRKSIHRLVASAFIPNIDNKPIVNHINGVKTDNRVENLEWCTYKENTAHAINMGLSTNEGRSFFYGKHHSDNTKVVMSIKKKGDKHPKFEGYYHTPYGIFGSSYEAATAENVSGNCIRYRCSSDKYPDYYIEYKKPL